MLLAGLTMQALGPNAVLYPLVLGSVSIIASIVGTVLRQGAPRGGKIMNALVSRPDRVGPDRRRRVPSSRRR